MRVTPGASRDKVLGLHGDALKVAVRQPPERGKANRAVTRLLADALDTRAANVTIARGETSRDKVVHFAGWSADALRARIQALLVTLEDA